MKKKHGLTLVEAAMTLAVVVLVVAMAMVFFQTASMRNKTNTAYEDVMAVRNAINSTYQNVPVYNNMTNSRLVATQALPNRLVNGNNIYHSFSGRINVSASDYSGGTRNIFNIELVNIPENACSELATKRYGKNFVRLRVNNNNISLPADPMQALSRCNQGDNNRITFSFL